jgi:cell fate regulator YaaT (PSP1 superfamily)
MKCVSVEFKSNGKQYTFNSNNLELKIGDYVIVETERGQQFGKISAILGELDDKKEHSNVLKIANDKDIKQNNNNIKEASEALKKAQEFANEYSLDMKFLDAYYTFDKKQLFFQFLADNRVDFRDLAKSLASIYKTRIELRQVGVRDKAKEISGIGACGRKLCCSNFLNDLDSVGIAQVKNQNLALNPNKINGLCGRLLCCLKFEDDLYTEYRKNLPEVGDKIEYQNETGTVLSIDIPNRKYVFLSENGNKIEVKVPFRNESTKKYNK